MVKPFLGAAAAAGIIVLAAAFMLWTLPVSAAECGKASWYGAAHEGRLMANGRPFHMAALTAASNALPLGTKVLVTAGSRTVPVTITDRGGFTKYGRIIDLSRAAFARLAPLDTGVIRVCIRAR